MLDGVPFPAAEVSLSFTDPAGDDGSTDGGALFPTGLPQHKNSPSLVSARWLRRSSMPAIRRFSSARPISA
ncbi:PrpF domain-containing protein [Zoogloea sp. LCSB751]|uniref:PrpF domain-containing protein n=1 Tax=Zoogloea sp. LCSB751 TaxID=1965277 RepID=UPI0020B147AE|nr:PrpF domain-containing protein [Zoogloea sp. LCSB751]